MEYKASHRHADMSARKVRKFADLIRGRTLDEAVQLLRYVPNRGARLLERVLLSAKGNAEDRGARDVEDLVVTESRVDDGPMFKRVMPRSRGTANMLFRRICHIHVALGDEEVPQNEITAPLQPQITTTTPTTPAVAPAPTVQS